MNLIEIKNLYFKYSGTENILNGISFNVEKGDFLCIVGENGSGKSTLIKCITGLNKGYEGELKVTNRIGYLPQKTDIQTNFPASIEEIVLTGTIPDGVKRIWYSKKDKEKANTVMKSLDLYDRRKKCFRELSGGQQQRVLIARAICATQDIILLDEPTNGLDPSIAKQIYDMLYKLNKEEKLTIVMVSHDIDRSIGYANKVVEIQNGKVVYNGQASEYNREV